MVQVDEEMNVALERSAAVVGRSEVVPVAEGIRDITTKDGGDARVERLKNSITKIRDQIEQTRKEFDWTCEVLRGSTGDVSGPGADAAEDKPSTPDTATDEDVDTQSTTTTSPITRPTNEETLEQARAAVNGHIKMLTKYNELKDVAMMFFGLLAEYQGVRVREVLRDRDVEVDD